MTGRTTELLPKGSTTRRQLPTPRTSTHFVRRHPYRSDQIRWSLRQSLRDGHRHRTGGPIRTSS